MQKPYTPSSTPVPEAQRADINRGVLNLIRAGKTPPRTKVFAAFTGRGGLHGLKYSDFSSRYEYSEAKRKMEQGQFFTPDWIVKLMADFLGFSGVSAVADLTCGAGAFANHFGGEKFFGLEIDQDAADVAKYLYPQSNIVTGDLRGWEPSSKFEAVCGNPPFALRWSVPGCPMANATGEATSEDVFLWKAAQAVSVGGTVCFVAPASWLTDDIVNAKVLAFIASKFERVAEVLLPVDSFKSVGVESFATKIILLRGYAPKETPAPSAPVIVDGRAMLPDQILTAWQTSCPEYFLFRKQIGAIRSEIAHADQRWWRIEKAKKDTLGYRFLRLVSELRRQSPEEAMEMDARWAEATAPAQYDKDGNRLSRLTPEGVIKNVRKALRQIDVAPRDLVRVVRTKDGISIKTYSRAAALAVSEARFSASNVAIGSGSWSELNFSEGIKSVARAVADRNERRLEKDASADVVTFETLNVGKTVRRLQRDFVQWNTPLASVAPDAKAVAKVEEFYRSHASHGVVIQPKQITAIANTLTKKGALIAWEMGCGKSLAALAWDSCKFADDVESGRKIAGGWTLIVSSALAVELHWKQYLGHFGLIWEQPEGLTAWNSIGNSTGPSPRYLLATHYQVSNFAKQIRELQRAGVIRALVVDESDEFGGRSATRSRRLLVAGRCIRHKLLLSGTPVRNNASELFSQLELLLHGESFFRCVATRKIVWSHEAGDFLNIKNPDFGSSYVGRGAFSLFKQCHAPARPTVMGAERALPSLPGRGDLVSFLDCFRSRIRLTDITSRVPYQRETLAVNMNVTEAAAYEELEKRAVEIACKHLRAETSERRASMLSLAHAIQLLQKATSLPAGCQLDGVLGSKHAELIKRIGQSSSSHVAVGVLWRDAVTHLEPILRKAFPDRTVIAFNGDLSFSARRKALAALNKADRAILLTTQQSLRSSLNLPIVTEVFAEALPWNFTSLNQWAMRFSRLTSKSTVTVNLMVVAGTIEERILGLILRKESVARPIAGDDVEEAEQLFAEYGIEAGELDDLANYLAEREPALRQKSAA